MSLVMRSGAGYALPAAGLDALALEALTRRGFLAGLGRPLGLGKESDVFEAIADDKARYAVKFFRLGRTSFRAARKKRGYSSPLRQHSWLVLNMQAAKREFAALQRLYPLKVPVPRPLARERHALVLELIEGTLLAELSPLPEPSSLLRQVLVAIRDAFLNCGVINADLSEYNLVYDGTRVWLIDWPQSQERSHPNADILLDRDLRNVLRFFERRGGVRCRLDDASAYVRGWTQRFPR
jgi:RIO kinase 2